MILIRFENLHGKINLSFFSFLLSRFLLSIEGKSKAKSKSTYLARGLSCKANLQEIEGCFEFAIYPFQLIARNNIHFYFLLLLCHCTHTCAPSRATQLIIGYYSTIITFVLLYKRRIRRILSLLRNYLAGWNRRYRRMAGETKYTCIRVYMCVCVCDIRGRTVRLMKRR